MPKIAQILVAAGIGARAGGDIPKQYRMIGGKTVLERTVQAMLASGKIDHTIIVIAKEDKRAKDILAEYDVTFVDGGATRTDSVKAGLTALQKMGPDYVLIHDAARPFVSKALISKLIAALGSAQAAVPVLPVADAMKSYEDGQIGADISRDQLRAVQTPQAFHYDKIVKAFNAQSETASFADDIAVAHAAHMTITSVEGERENIKLTYPADFIRAERDLMGHHYTATGTGFDVHRFSDDSETMWLCGVPIKCGYTLLGHSDADVGLHALTDAILGAACAGDIGDHFPPSDPQWKGAKSDKFLKFASDLVQEKGGSIEHVDVTLICEKPKIKPHREAMREAIADILSLPLTRVSVKATTTEQLGFTGRGEGIAAQANATVSLPA
ncbi:MAG: bifunctional 2-C-methyl-D-erythritol 4-phosphate cytidylyltransferase/2-C-methyl-D-erythritol 2,4-cyclodiphosphate synthase [Maricaulaceae bacterium]